MCQRWKIINDASETHQIIFHCEYDSACVLRRIPHNWQDDDAYESDGYVPIHRSTLSARLSQDHMLLDLIHLRDWYRICCFFKTNCDTGLQRGWLHHGRTSMASTMYFERIDMKTVRKASQKTALHASTSNSSDSPSSPASTSCRHNQT